VHTPIVKAEPTTLSEALLARLATGAFLTPWSYPRVHRDQPAQNGSVIGKELCDLLVVFGKHVIIFSDKSCAIPYSGDLERDWARWYRKAVLASVRQVLGAERWLREHPDRLFLDPQCKRPFPYPLPTAREGFYHRIVIARGASLRCSRELGGSGSMMLRSDFPDTVHTPSEVPPPFTVGHVGPQRGLVHILDDTTLTFIFQALDTIVDFTDYLERKERLFTSGRSVWSAGEEELLGHYLKNMGADGHHDFAIPTDMTGIAFQEGIWQDFQRNPQRIAQLRANEISYAWDALIEAFSTHAFGGTSYFTSHPGFQTQEQLLRVLASESRTKRRGLAEALLGIMADTPPDLRATRVIVPESVEWPYYVFLLLPWRDDKSEGSNRLVRRNFLEACCMTVKLIRPEAQTIVGIATESGRKQGGSEDLMLLDARNWTPEMAAEAQEWREKLNLFPEVKLRPYHLSEYPNVDQSVLREHRNRDRQRQLRSEPSRNGPCPCGSGRRYKHCHGK
jgi:hypothetical protein